MGGRGKGKANRKARAQAQAQAKRGGTPKAKAAERPQVVEAQRRPVPVAPPHPPTPPPPTPEQVIGAVVAAIVPELFDEAAEEAPARADAIPPRRGEEHRAHARVAVAVAIGLETESHFFAGLSGDISEGGVFVQTYRDLPVGSDVDVLFDLPDGQLTAHGTVRWHRSNSDSSPPGVGIAFEELGDDDRRVIQRFCESRAPLYYEVDHA